MCPPDARSGPPSGRSPAPPPVPAALPDLGELYQELILDHYRRPRNKGKLEQPTHSAALNNPLCGDEVDLELRVQDDVIRDVRFVGRGCSISQAAASMMTQVIKDRPLPEALSLASKMSAMMHGDEAAAHDKALGDLRALVGVARFPVRVKCALLPWNALQDALKSSGTAPR